LLSKIHIEIIEKSVQIDDNFLQKVILVSLGGVISNLGNSWQVRDPGSLTVGEKARSPFTCWQP
jgi:hypothetical protein